MKLNQKSLLILILSISPFIGLTQEYPSNQEIANVIKKEVDNGRSSSIVVGIIDNGKENYICYGNPFAGKTLKADERTIYEIASITKVFVATIFADLVLKGELSLDDPLIKYLPDTLVFKDKKGEKITLKHLATHTSGLPNLFDKPDLRDIISFYKNYTYNILFTSLEKYQFQHNPGTNFSYSNLNMALLAYVICKVTNRDLESLIRERICEPFQMKNTALKLSKEQEEYFATAYNRPERPIEHWVWNANAGAGGLRSTAQDLITFMRKLFYEDSPLKKAADFAIIPQFDSTRFPNTKIGLGWFIKEGKNSLEIVHGGTAGGFKSFILYDKLKNRGIVVLSNSSRDISDIGSYLFDKKSKINEFENIKSIELDNDLFNQVEGTYSFNMGNNRDTISVYKKDKFFFMYAGKVGEMEMFYQGKNSFLVPYVNVKIKFQDFNNNNKAQTIIGWEKVFREREFYK